MSNGRHIVVAGAGIGGLTAALALARAGCTVTICERADAFSPIGAGIQIAPNATAVLTALGLEEAMARESVEPPAIELLGGVSHRLRVSVPTARFRERFGAPYRVIHRADLHRVLADAVADAGIDIMLSTNVLDAGQGDQGVTVTIRRGDATDRLHAAALVAADGVWSRLRAVVRPGSAEAMPLGRSVWRAVVPKAVAAPHVNPDVVGLWLAADAHVVHYPVSKGESVNIVVIVDERWDHRGWSHVADAAGLRRHAADWPGTLRHLIEQTDDWHKYAAATVPAAAPWVSGRIALLGDAAHAMPPFLAQGAAMAIEDAWVLARALDEADDVAGAFKRYEAERRRRVIRVARDSDRAGTIYEYSGGMAAARDVALSIGGAWLVMTRADWIYAWRPPGL